MGTVFCGPRRPRSVSRKNCWITSTPDILPSYVPFSHSLSLLGDICHLSSSLSGHSSPRVSSLRSLARPQPRHHSPSAIYKSRRTSSTTDLLALLHSLMAASSDSALIKHYFYPPSPFLFARPFTGYSHRLPVLKGRVQASVTASISDSHRSFSSLSVIRVASNEEVLFAFLTGKRRDAGEPQ